MPATGTEARVTTFEEACATLGLMPGESYSTTAVRQAETLKRLPLELVIATLSRDTDRYLDLLKVHDQLAAVHQARELLLDGYPESFQNGTIDEIVVEDETIERDGVTMTASYYWSFSRLVVTAEIHDVDVSKLTALPLTEYGYANVIRVLSDDESVQTHHVVTFSHFKEMWEARQRDNARRDARELLQQRINAARQTIASLKREGLPTKHLTDMLTKAERLSYGNYRRNWSSQSCDDALKGVERAIEAVRQNPIDSLVDALMRGDAHQIQQSNYQTIQTINTWSIMTGGWLKANPWVQYIDEERLRAFYRKRIEQTNITSLERALLHPGEFLLALEDYFVEEMIVEAGRNEEFDIAQPVIVLHGNKGYQEYPMDFVLTDDGPECQLTIPLSVYDKNPYEYGKNEPYFWQPHGIAWHLFLTVQGRVVCHGRLDVIDTKVKKYKRSVQRSKNASKVDENGLTRFGPNLGTTPPPWHVRGR